MVICTKPDIILVDRLWSAYQWPERNLPMRYMTVEKLSRFPVQAVYVSDVERTWKRPTRAWDYGRVRHFYERARQNFDEQPITIDNECDEPRIYPIPIVTDGHHRLAGAHLAGKRTILAHYGGCVDLLRYLMGARKTRPKGCT